MRTVKADSAGIAQGSDIPISLLTRVGTTATCTTTKAHRLATGDRVKIRGIAPQAADEGQVELYNVDSAVVTVSTTKIFTYVLEADPGFDAVTTGDSVVRKLLYAEDYNPFAIIDPNGKLIVTPGAGTSYSNPSGTGLDAVCMLAEPGKLIQLEVVNSDAATDYWVLLVNKATTPVNTDVAINSIRVLRENQNYFGPYHGGVEFSAGIAVAMSTTPGVVTLPATNKGFFFARFDR